MILGSHTFDHTPDFFLGCAEQELSFGGNVFAFYSGAPQNSNRRPLSEMKVQEGLDVISKNNMHSPLLHAPYIINLANTEKAHNFAFGVEFLHDELKRAEAFHSTDVTFHPGSAVGGDDTLAMKQLAKGLDEALDGINDVRISLETMAGKGSEIGWKFEQLAEIMSYSKNPEKLSVTFDTCHVFDAGYDIKNNFENVLHDFDNIIGLDKIQVVHLNDSKFGLASHKDRHANIGFGKIGFDALNYIAHYEGLETIPKSMETPKMTIPDSDKKLTTYKYEIQMLKDQKFDPNMYKKIEEDYNKSLA